MEFTRSVPLALLFTVNWWQVTTKGVKHIARGCPNLAVLNLYHCSKVQVRLVATVIAHMLLWAVPFCEKLQPRLLYRNTCCACRSK